MISKRKNISERNNIKRKQSHPENALLIFDMDGVLIDINRTLYRAAIKTAEEYCRINENKKILFSLKDIYRIKKIPGYNSDWKTCAKMVSDALQKEIAEGSVEDENSLKRIFEENYLGEQSFFEEYGLISKRKCKGLIREETLILKKENMRRLRKKNDLAIFTGRPKKQAMRTLENLKIKDFFIEIICEDDVKKGKPSPDGLIEIHKRTGFKKAYFFGDNIHDDMNAASGANDLLGNIISPIGVIPPGEEDHEEIIKAFIKNKAEAVLKDINELFSLI